ncbi:MAG: TetR/AcrR family transcriptional regulator [Acetobacteraceae bacterium]|nr:TetR/AcrR family transcriptional regulator [Acetobacteraceae bacterium]
MARLTRAESQARTRERLIASGRIAFARTGYVSASIEEIAEGAGFSKGAFYSNFATKEALALEIARFDTDEVVQATVTAIDHAKGNPDRMMANVAALARSLSENPDRYILRAELMLHAARSPGFAAAYQEQYIRQHQQITELIATLLYQLNVPPLSAPSVLASAVMALAQGHALLRPVGDPSSFAETLRTFLDTAVHRARLAAEVDKSLSTGQPRASSSEQPA